MRPARARLPLFGDLRSRFAAAGAPGPCAAGLRTHRLAQRPAPVPLGLVPPPKSAGFVPWACACAPVAPRPEVSSRAHPLLFIFPSAGFFASKGKGFGQRGRGNSDILPLSVHLFCDIDRNMFLSVMHGHGVAHELREDGAGKLTGKPVDDTLFLSIRKMVSLWGTCTKKPGVLFWRRFYLLRWFVLHMRTVLLP